MRHDWCNTSGSLAKKCHSLLSVGDGMRYNWWDCLAKKRSSSVTCPLFVMGLNMIHEVAAKKWHSPPVGDWMRHCDETVKEKWCHSPTVGYSMRDETWWDWMCSRLLTFCLQAMKVFSLYMAKNNATDSLWYVWDTIYKKLQCYLLPVSMCQGVMRLPWRHNALSPTIWYVGWDTP